MRIKAPTRVYRAKLPHGGMAFDGHASIPDSLYFKLRQMDKDLELHAFPDGTVHAYRVKGYAATPNDDLLVHQFMLKWPPGSWLIDCLNQCDTWKQYGVGDKAVDKQLDEHEDISTFAERQARLKTSEISQAMAPEIIRKIERKRELVHLGTPGPSRVCSRKYRGST